MSDLAHAQRIAVIGCGGAGKTFVATRLATKYGLPLIHADGLVYRDGELQPEAEGKGGTERARRRRRMGHRRDEGLSPRASRRARRRRRLPRPAAPRVLPGARAAQEL